MFSSISSRKALSVHRFLILILVDWSPSLWILFARYVVPPTCRYDNTNEIIQGKFHQMFKDASCQMQHLEPYTPWSNATKKLWSWQRALFGSSLSQNLWNAFGWLFKLESYIRSKMAHNIFKLNGEATETIMSGETFDICQFWECE